MTPSCDWSSASGAQELAQKIQAYWAKLGVQLIARVERLGDVQKTGQAVFMVRSNFAAARQKWLEP